MGKESAVDEEVVDAEVSIDPDLPADFDPDALDDTCNEAVDDDAEVAK